jgi:hypothetical protein
MKKIILYILGIFCISMAYKSVAQVCPDTVTQISTNYLNPINTQFAITHPAPKVNPFVNKFNWSGFDGYGFAEIPINLDANWISSINNGTLISPYASMNYGYNYINKKLSGLNPRTIEEMIDSLDWTWENGWELMYLHNGYFPNGDKINIPNADRVFPREYSIAQDRMPLYMIYNRYTGKLRMFATISTHEWSDVNYVNNNLGYRVGLNQNVNVQVSGIFRHMGNYDRPLDMITINTGVTAVNSYKNNDLQFFTNDFQLGYDPCVCNYATNINFEVVGITQYYADLYGRSLQLQVPVNEVSADFLTNSSINQANESGASLMYYKSQKMYEDYMQQLEEYNSDLKDYNSTGNRLKKAALDLAKKAVSTAVGTAFPAPELKKFILGNAITLKGKSWPDTSTVDGWIKAAREASKSIVGKGFDHLTNGFIADKPYAPTMPMATLSEMRITGNITGTRRLGISGLYTPGSFYGADVYPHQYPVYNKPTGLFALLEKPQISIYNSIIHLPKQIVDTGFCMNKKLIFGSVPISFHYDTLYGTPTRVKYASKNMLYFKLDEPLSYKYNDHVQIDKTKTKTYVSYIIEYDVDNTFINKYNKSVSILLRDGNKIDSVGYHILDGNINLMHDYVNRNDTNHRTRIFETGWADILDINQQVYGLEFLDSLFNRSVVTWFGSKNSCYNLDEYKLYQSWPVRLKNIKMKIMTDIYFTDNPNMNTSQVFTYSIFDRDNPETETSVLNYTESLPEIKKYNLGEIYLSEVYIDPNHMYVTRVTPTEIFIDAEYIRLGGGVSVAPGFTLRLNALYDIIVDPETILVPEIVLEIKKDYYNLPVFKEVTNAELSSYCNGQNKRYNANQSFAKHAPNPEEAIDVIDKDAHYKQSLQVGLYPNPANSAFEVYTNAKGDYTITMIDITGRLVYTSEIVQNNKGIMDVSQLQNGIYFVQVTGNGHTTTQKIIVRH